MPVLSLLREVTVTPPPLPPSPHVIYYDFSFAFSCGPGIPSPVIVKISASLQFRHQQEQNISPSQEFENAKNIYRWRPTINSSMCAVMVVTCGESSTPPEISLCHHLTPHFLRSRCCLCHNTFSCHFTNKKYLFAESVSSLEKPFISFRIPTQTGRAQEFTVVNWFHHVRKHLWGKVKYLKCQVWGRPCFPDVTFIMSFFARRCPSPAHFPWIKKLQMKITKPFNSLLGQTEFIL